SLPAFLASPQALEHVARGKAIGNCADRGLKIADREPGLRTEPAVRCADAEAALVDREHRFVARPSLHERRAAVQPIGQMADGERVSLGWIVFHDDAEIIEG